ncbi:MAG: MarR family transcriptional regulator [Peptococcaceae bacterium]|nr:MarR family transcriptional regulator [Peptococcaceae bacterium]
MKSNNDIYEFIMDNVQKIVLPEEMIKIDLSLSKLELLALIQIGKFQSITMTSLAQGISVPMSTATGIVDRLVKKGLLKRGRSEKDRRVVTVSLTESGRSLVSDLKGHFHNFIERVRNTLTGEEFETGLNLVRKVIIGLQKSETAADNTLRHQRKKIEIE